MQPSQLGKTFAKESDFDAPTENMTSLTPLLYQSGYLTIKDYDNELQFYTLDLPNREIQVGLFESLLPHYLPLGQNGTMGIVGIARYLRDDDMDHALRLLQDFLSSIPYCNVTNHEGHYQQMLFIIFTLLTPYMVDVEVHTQRGRIDMVVMTRNRIFIMELKLNKDAQTAMRQIDLKDYRKRFALSPLPVTKVGVNFDSTKGNITDWTID